MLAQVEGFVALIDLACETRDLDHVRSDDPVEAAGLVVSDEVALLWTHVREESGFQTFAAGYLDTLDGLADAHTGSHPARPRGGRAGAYRRCHTGRVARGRRRAGPSIRRVLGRRSPR